MRARYQYGDLRIRKRSKGPDVWQFRYLENGKRKSVLIGTVEKYPNKADAEKAVEHRRIEMNLESPQREFHSVTLGGLMDRFMQEYAAKHCRLNTRKNYQGLIDNHIRPRWGREYIQNVRPMLVEAWLDDYREYGVELKDGKKVTKSVSRAVKSHIRNLMHTVFQRALFWEMLDRNPISLIHQSQKRLKKPRALTAQEFKLLVPQLAEPYKTLVIVHQCLGLRVCETVALQWGDISFENLTVHVQRSFVRGEVNPVKTTKSDSTLPLDPDLASILLDHKAHVQYNADSDYVFAGPTGAIRWPESMLQNHIKPAAKRAGIGNVGWHTFRHTYSTLLHELGAQPAVQQELLRHADIRTTMNVYTQAIPASMWETASKALLL